MATTSSTGVACHIIYKWQEKQQQLGAGCWVLGDTHPRGTYNLALFICKCLLRHTASSCRVAGSLFSSRFMSTAATSLSAQNCCSYTCSCCCPYSLPLFGSSASAAVCLCVTDIKCSWWVGSVCRFAEKRFAIY